MGKWEAQYNQLMNSGREDGEYDYGTALNEAWKDEVANDSVMKFDDDGLPVLGNYVFGE